QPEPLNPIDDLMQYDAEYRRMFARYRARSQHLMTVRRERIELLSEAAALWDDEAYIVQLECLINDLVTSESAVLSQASNFVDNHKPGDRANRGVDRDVLFARLDSKAEDKTRDDYQAIL